MRQHSNREFRSRSLGWVGFVLVGLLLPASGKTQSLAEVAKKEKARRESVGKSVEDEPETIGNDALRRAKGEGLSITGSEVDIEGSKNESLLPASPSSATSTGSPEASRATRLPSAAELRARRDAYLQRLESARASVQSLEEQLETCRQATLRPSAFIGRVDCSSLEAQLRQAGSQLRSVQGRHP